MNAEPELLSRATLARLPAALRPSVPPGEVTPGVVHLGIGAFARAHQAVVLERMMTGTGDTGWGMVGVSQRSCASATALRRQDCLYGLMVDDSLRLVGSVCDAYFAGTDHARLLDDLAAPTTRLVTVTVTEKGYRYGVGKRRLDLADAVVAADLTGRSPRSMVGRLATGLAKRMRATAAPLTVLSCDNLPANGSLLGGLVDDFLDATGDKPARAWVREHVRFPDTVVDRMVPKASEQTRAMAHRALGVRDECALVTEPYLEWVIGDPGPGALPDLAAGGAVLSTEPEAYAHRKLRVLNAAHSALCWLGVLAGHRYVAEVVADEPIAASVRSMLEHDVLPVLRAPRGTRLIDYLDSVFARCANPRLRHATRQVCSDGTLKVGPRLLDSAVERLRAGHLPVRLAGPVAAWLHCTTVGTDRAGRPLELDDPGAAAIRAAGNTREALHRVHPEVAEYAEFVREVDKARAELATHHAIRFPS